MQIKGLFFKRQLGRVFRVRHCAVLSVRERDFFQKDVKILRSHVARDVNISCLIKDDFLS